MCARAFGQKKDTPTKQIMQNVARNRTTVAGSRHIGLVTGSHLIVAGSHSTVTRTRRVQSRGVILHM